jgi:hypothetical protein
MIFYLSNQYYSVIGHEGILCFLPLCGKFWNAIEVYCQKDCIYIDPHGAAILVPGMDEDELPFNICGFIDNTVNLILVPYSGQAGDFEGALHWPQYILVQESVYSGHKKVHGHKMETVFFPAHLAWAPALVQFWLDRMIAVNFFLYLIDS